MYSKNQTTADTTPKFDDRVYARSSLAEVVLPLHLHAPFWRRRCVRTNKNSDGGNGQAWTHRSQKTRNICDACAWLRPPADFEDYGWTVVHWLAAESRAVDLTRCTVCRYRHLAWKTPENCTGFVYGPYWI